MDDFGLLLVAPVAPVQPEPVPVAPVVCVADEPVHEEGESSDAEDSVMTGALGPPPEDEIITDEELDLLWNRIHFDDACQKAIAAQSPPRIPSPRSRPAKRYLASLNAHANDDRLYFDPVPHKYYIDGSGEFVTGATTWIHGFFEAFDSDAQAQRTVESKSFREQCHRPSFKYHGCTCAADVVSVWNRKRDLGTAMHDAIERHLNGEPWEVEEENRQCMDMFFNFTRTSVFTSFETYRTEWSIFDPDLRICGTVDWLARDPVTGKFMIGDWKRVEDISDCSFKRLRGLGPDPGIGPLREYDNCKFVLYALQLNLYCYILEKYYGVQVSHMFLVQIHPVIVKRNAAKGREQVPNVWKVPRMTPEIMGMVECRRRILRRAGYVPPAP